MNAHSICNICTNPAEIYLNLEDVPPIQNRFLSTVKEAQAFTSTEVQFIWCENCQHISVNKNKKYDFDYNYDNQQAFSSYAQSQLEGIVKDIEKQIPSRNAFIVEIGCGRGELLQMLRDSGYKKLKGFDPAAPFSTDIISNKFWNGLEHENIDLIICRHTMEEFPDPNKFIGLMSQSLSASSCIYCEITNAPNLLNMASQGGVFVLYPEYINLFSALSLSKLYAIHGLSIDKVTSINSGEWLGVWGKKNTTTSISKIADYLKNIAMKVKSLPKPIVLWGAAGREYFVILKDGIIGYKLCSRSKPR